MLFCLFLCVIVASTLYSSLHMHIFLISTCYPCMRPCTPTCTLPFPFGFHYATMPLCHYAIMPLCTMVYTLSTHISTTISPHSHSHSHAYVIYTMHSHSACMVIISTYVSYPCTHSFYIIHVISLLAPYAYACPLPSPTTMHIVGAHLVCLCLATLPARISHNAQTSGGGAALAY